VADLKGVIMNRAKLMRQTKGYTRMTLNENIISYLYQNLYFEIFIISIYKNIQFFIISRGK